MSAIIGLDLGTTKSRAYLYKDDKSQNLIDNLEQSIPSIIAWTETACLLGNEAKAQAVTNPKGTISAAKRLIGQKYDSPEVKEWVKNLPYSVIELPDGEAGIKVGDKEYKGEELAALILSKLKSEAEAKLGETITETIISVPAYFSYIQRERIKKACEIAGLTCLRIISDTVATAFTYSQTQKQANQKVAIFSIGGGATSVSILEVSDGVVEAKSENGDLFLGGLDIDQRIVQYLIDEFKMKTGVDLSEDNMALQRLLEVAEKVKIELSSVEETEINLPYIANIEGKNQTIQTRLSRSHLNSLDGDLMARIEPISRKALEDAGHDPEDIHTVILIGGMTKMPLVQQQIRKIFGEQVKYIISPEENIAIGAAIQGGILAGDVKDILSLDIIPHSIGIETVSIERRDAETKNIKKDNSGIFKNIFKRDKLPYLNLDIPLTQFALGTEKNKGVFTKIVDRNTTIPTVISRTFTTAEDNQTSVIIHVLQGESSKISEDTSLASFELNNIPPDPHGVPQIELSLAIDGNGIIKVTAKDMGTGREKSVKINEEINTCQNNQAHKTIEELLMPPSSDIKSDKIEQSNVSNSESNEAQDKETSVPPTEGYGPKIHGLQLGLPKKDIAKTLLHLQEKYNLILNEEENEYQLLSENNQEIQLNVELDDNGKVISFLIAPKIFKVKTFQTPKFLNEFKQYYHLPNLSTDLEEEDTLREINEEQNYTVLVTPHQIKVEQLNEDKPYFA